MAQVMIVAQFAVKHIQDVAVVKGHIDYVEGDSQLIHEDAHEGPDQAQ